MLVLLSTIQPASRTLDHLLLYLHLYYHREGGVAPSFALSAGFPPKDVTDSAITIAEAGLLDAAITQKAV